MVESRFSEEELVELQKELDSIYWYHKIDLPYGLEIKNERHHFYLLEQQNGFKYMVDKTIAHYRNLLDQFDFNNKTVLDVGCADGLWSFYAEQRNASNVLAIDDLTITWVTGQGIHIAKKILDSKIEINQHINLYDITSLNRTFDIIIFFGVFYHLQSLFYGLCQLRHICHENTKIFVSGGLSKENEKHIAEYRFNNSEESPYEVFNILLPINTFCILLEMAYFKIDSILSQPPWPFLVVSPFYGKNRRHIYRPSFNLHKYDPRWSENT